jgi:Plasmid pRiA4b ORF-3-like protein
MEHDSQPEAYYVHVWIRGIHPMLWRRFLVRSDSTLADLHAVLQIGFDWADFHLHRFRIRKKDYAVAGSAATTHGKSITIIKRMVPIVNLDTVGLGFLLRSLTLSRRSFLGFRLPWLAVYSRFWRQPLSPVPYTVLPSRFSFRSFYTLVLFWD